MANNEGFSGGDFNIILHPNGSSDYDILGPILSSDLKDFQDALLNLELYDHPFFGPLLTWSNKQKNSFLARKLDRVLINSKWAISFQDSHVEFLAPGIFDHCFTKVWLKKEVEANRPKLFKFFNYWTQHPNFLEVMNQTWQIPTYGNPMHSLFNKLRRVKECLKALNQASYSDLSAIVKQKRIDLELQQLTTLLGDGIDKEILLQNELKTLEEAEALFFRDTIHILIDEQGNRLETYDQISTEIIDYFSNLLGKVDPTVKETDPTLLKNLFHFNFPVDKADGLVKEVTKEEIKEAFFSQGNEKSPGPDGFSPFFFKKTWPIIERDINADIHQFFRDSFLLLAFNATVIALIPNIPNPSKVCLGELSRVLSSLLVLNIALCQ
ncbi:uncharacterized protein LOC120131000 [Hibiscus syriacus]|uniref:uncharacterized protein LOC120131000 n=1 Tax=Hibiscus syriacus TaxID=106335 RepID=UPI001922B1DA|nr:uncharacterized protein LOC120131000 [Hibiscus syriacus]